MKPTLRKEDVPMAVRKIVRPFETIAFVLMVLGIVGIFASIIVATWVDWRLAIKIFSTSFATAVSFGFALKVILQIEKNTIAKVKEMVK